MSEMNDLYEWAIQAKEHLKNKRLIFRCYPQDFLDHSHCEICWGKFGKHGELSKGHYEESSNSWICEECFENLQGRFGWSLDLEENLCRFRS